MCRTHKSEFSVYKCEWKRTHSPEAWLHCVTMSYFSEPYTPIACTVCAMLRNTLQMQWPQWNVSLLGKGKLWIIYHHNNPKHRWNPSRRARVTRLAVAGCWSIKNQVIPGEIASRIRVHTHIYRTQQTELLLANSFIFWILT